VLQGLKGTTPGKAILRIKVVRSDGGLPGIWRTIVRELVWIVDFWLVGWTTAMLSQNNQRLGDMRAGTYVVKRDFAGATDAQPQPLQPANWYPDPHGQARLRYWDGQRWTEHTSA
jgi:uncharacterized RDD family membrane protein YckC